MQLDADTLDQLTRFYSRRLPAAAPEIAAGLGLSVTTWPELVIAAHRARRLPALARAVAQQIPGDELASQMARDLRPSRPWGLVAAVAAIGALALVAWPSAEPVVEPVPQVAAETVAEPVAAALTPVEVAPPLVPSDRVPRGGCKAPNGQTVGWWYAGASAPGREGETITLRRGANVRAGVPAKKNGWRLQPAVGCGLQAGDVITLGTIAEIPGGVWVELRG